jgi:hypothetical protein
MTFAQARPVHRRGHEEVALGKEGARADAVLVEDAADA